MNTNYYPLIEVKRDVTNSENVLFAAKGTKVNKTRLLNLLATGQISYSDFERAAGDTSISERATAYISYQVGKLLPCVPEDVRNEVTEIVDSSSEKAVDYISCLERRSLWSYEHSMRVAIIAVAIGRIYGMKEDELKTIAEGAIVHDIGKIFFMDLVEKPFNLNETEATRIREHTKAGYRFLKGAGFSEEVALAALLHHERADGNGYWGVTNIPLYIQTISIADCIDAIMAERPYKTSKSVTEAVMIISKEKLFGTALTKAAKKALQET